MASLDEIMADRDPAPVEPRAITDADRAANPIGMATLERDRDQAGRWTAKEAATDQPEPEGEEPAEADPDAQHARKPGAVPPKALQAERQKRQAAEARESEREAQSSQRIAALERQLAEMRGAVMARQQPQPASAPPKPTPQFWEDPDAATDHRLRQALDPVTQQLQETRLFYSQRLAVQEHGAETVEEAKQHLRLLQQHNPAEYQRLEVLTSRSMDPVGDVARWYKNQRALQTYGANPDAYINAEIERRLAERGAAAPSPAPAPTPSADQRPPRLPTSFAAQPNGGPRGGGGYGGPRPLSEILPRG